MPEIKQIAPFGRSPDGRSIEQFVLDSGNGCTMRVATLGGSVLGIETPDRLGRPGGISLGLTGVDDMMSPGNGYIGKLIGRVANRIAGGRFELDGRGYRVPINNGPNSLHGGKIGYDKRIFDASVDSAGSTPSLSLTLLDPAGSEGFPGAVVVRVTYTLTGENIFRIAYAATADAPTPINLTYHGYFNLKDGGRSSVLDHEIRIHASSFTPNNTALIPTGRIEPLEGAARDYRQPRPIGSTFERLRNERTDVSADAPLGIDDNFIVDGKAGELRVAAEVYEPITGRTMNVLTTEPAMQFYTGNFLDGTITGPGGVRYQQYAGFCLEAQHHPNAVNEPKFPNSILRPGETYRQTTEYQFGVRE